MSRKRLRSTFSGSEAVVNFASGFIRGSSSNSRVKSWSWKFSELKTMMRELIDVGMGFARLAEGGRVIPLLLLLLLMVITDEVVVECGEMVVEVITPAEDGNADDDDCTQLI